MVDNFISDIENFSQHTAIHLNLKDYPKYRIFKDTHMIGWLTEVQWNWDKAQGILESTRNEAGKKFSEESAPEDNIGVKVVIEGCHYTPATMYLSDNKATLIVQKKVD